MSVSCECKLCSQLIGSRKTIISVDVALTVSMHAYAHVRAHTTGALGTAVGDGDPADDEDAHASRAITILASGAR